MLFERDEAGRIPGLVYLACVISVAFLVGFWVLHSFKSTLMDLPVQWLWVCVVPVLVALILGNYISAFKAAGLELTFDRKLLKLGDLKPGSGTGTEADVATLAAAVANPDPESKAFLEKKWADEIQERHKLFLAYIYQSPSTLPGQKYDVTIFLKRHVWGVAQNESKFENVEKAEFYFGPSWGGQVFQAGPTDITGGLVGMRVSAWGSFWATCRVKFRGDATPVILHRHIDFEMPPYPQSKG